MEHPVGNKFTIRHKERNFYAQNALIDPTASLWWWNPFRRRFLDLSVFHQRKDSPPILGEMLPLALPLAVIGRMDFWRFVLLSVPFFAFRAFIGFPPFALDEIASKN